jgi:hypothetical protein
MSDPNYIVHDIVFNTMDPDNFGTKDHGKFEVTNLNNISAMTLLWANIPYSYYVIDRLNNEFQIIYENEEPEEEQVTAVACRIQPGTYTPPSFCNELRRVFTSNENVYAGADYRAYIDDRTARLVIYNTSLTGNENFKILINDKYLAEILGFPLGTTVTSHFGQLFKDGELLDSDNDDNNLHYIVAPGLLNLTFASVIELRSNLSNYLEYSSRRPTWGSEVVGIFPLNTIFTGYLFQPGNGNAVPCGKLPSLPHVEFYLSLPGRDKYAANSTSEDNNDYVIQQELPLNGQGFQVCIRFHEDTGYQS